MKHAVLVCFAIVLAATAWGQDPNVKITRDTIILNEPDSVLSKTYASRYNPRKALLYAAVIPGLGQVYNKKYWKLPLVYGGFYGVANRIKFYDDGYSTYKAHLYYNLEHNLAHDGGVNPETRLTTSQLRRIVDNARRDRDLWVILMGAMYLLQMVDAHVDSHLKEFDLNPDLKTKVSIEPTISQDAVLGRQTGVSLIFRF
jgi:hypothetical protein